VEFIAKYGRSYTSKEEVNIRFENFARNYEMVKKHNARGGYQLEMNQFSDYSEAEFKQKRNLAPGFRELLT